jgi:tRNA dimethylallyltransferase
VSADQILGNHDPISDCWFLTGATASGKTEISMELARTLGAEIVSLDSMAIYREMDIGTAKPKPYYRTEIPHHLIDIIDPTDTFSVSQYRNLALSVIGEIRSRNREVLFVGGTALYLKALLRGLFEGPPANWELRKEIEDELAEMGNEYLHQRLAMVDPVAAHLLHPNDQRRIIRALEVYRLTGKPISHWQLQFDQARPTDQCRVFSIRHSRPILHERIEQRVEKMFEAGLIEEVRRLLDKWNELSHTAAQAVGYQEAIAHLQGKLSLAETLEKTKVRTRKFARHQETWFRALSECRLIDLPADYQPQQVAAQMITAGRQVGQGQKSGLN